MTRSPKYSAVALAGLALMILAGACSRNNESTGQSNRGATQTQGSDSATQYNDQNANPNYTTTPPGGTTGDLQKDLADFRTQVDKKVADNAKAINDKRAELANVQSSMRAEFKKMLDDAEVRNNEIRDRVLNYTPTDRAAWDQFRNDTNTALDGISASIGKIDIK